ncbi:MAG: glycosyltransferase [Gemmatimonadota bacterium]|nr:glycosyltransferase [Gemmatimonadota bacterium]
MRLSYLTILYAAPPPRAWPLGLLPHCGSVSIVRPHHWASGPPLLPDVGVIGLVPDQWSPLWQPRHHVLRRLAAFFNVVWVNPAPDWPHLVRTRRSPAQEPAEEGWSVDDAPAWLPTIHRPAKLRTLLRTTRIGRARQRLLKQGARHTVLYLWRPGFADALETPHDFSVYHIDDDYAFDETRVGLTPLEAATIGRVNQVIIHSPRLMELKGGLNPRTAFVPNGVDYDAYSAPAPEPADLAAIPRPRIGYAGWIKPQLDWALLDGVATRCPEMSLIFVGQNKPLELLMADPSYRVLTHRPNVFFLGVKTTDELAAYPQHFDVCIMPYRIDPYTDCIYPLKLHEYLASGRPVAGTPIRSLEDFSGTVTLARTPDEWCAALRQSLAPLANTESERRRRQQVAREHEWWKLTGRIADLIAKGMEHPEAGRIRAWVADRTSP